MSTRANIILVTPNNLIHQFYHHYDGYLSGVGEELRNYLNDSIEMRKFYKNMSIYAILVNELERNDKYKDEYKSEFDDFHRIYGNVEYIYVVKDSKLYYACDCGDAETYYELIDYICKEENLIALDKPVKDERL